MAEPQLPPPPSSHGGRSSQAVTGKPVFISYRRNESIVEARAIYERLERAFPGKIFIDLGTLEYGEDFAEVVAGQLEGCTVMLALIGPTWLTAKSPSGRRRLDESSDFVRIEVRAALNRHIRVIPVLLNSATIPHESELPTDIVGLTRRHAMHLDFGRFDADIESLCDVIRRQLAAPAREATDGRPSGSSVGGSDAVAAAARTTTEELSNNDGASHSRPFGWIAALALAVLAGTGGFYLLRSGNSSRTYLSPTVAPIPTSDPAAPPVKPAPQESHAKWRVYSTGRFDLQPTYPVSLDSGKVGDDLSEADLWFQDDGLKGGPFLSPQNGAQIVQTDARNVDWCEQAKFQTSPYPVSRLAPGMQFCARTRTGRPSVFVIEKLGGEGDNRTITIGYTTWDRQ
jgi:TIR domain-containing protein